MMEASVTRVLLVVSPFGAYGVGDLIAGAKEMRAVLAGAHAQDVLRVAAPIAVADKREET